METLASETWNLTKGETLKYGEGSVGIKRER